MHHSVHVMVLTIEAQTEQAGIKQGGTEIVVDADTKRRVSLLVCNHRVVSPVVWT